MTEEERYRRFDALQSRMPGVWNAMRLNHDDESIVVVPSISLDRAVSASGSMSQAYEERFLFLLVLLRQPRLRMVYVTSMPIAPEIVEYYLALLSGVIPSHARARLSLISVNDASGRSLSEKLLARPRLLRRIADLVPNPARSHMVPYNTTELERDVALSIGIPMYGADPRLAELGIEDRMPTTLRRGRACPTRWAPRTCTASTRSPTPWSRCGGNAPSMASAIVKLNEGVSGSGNAVVTLTGLPSPGSPDERAEVMTRLQHMDLESETTPFEVYVAKFAEGGGIVEERITGQELQSPSVQLRVLPSGEVELLSTHDQLLGGPSGQMYLGCVFPAAAAYARLITRHAEQIGQRLAREGALGRFAVDFVVVRDAGGSWTPYAIELNLRRGGTTHPFLTLQFLTDGRYDPATALFTTPRGREKHLVATDHLESPDLRGLVPADLFDIVARHGLHFDQSRQEGIVFHMISCLTEHGRVGMTVSRGHSARRQTAAIARPRGFCWTRLGWLCRSNHFVSDRFAVQAVWYVAYASNLALDRFRSYLCGGRPSGGLRDYAGLSRCARPGAPRQPAGDGRARVRGQLLRMGWWHGVPRPEGRRVGSHAAPTSSRQSSSRT